MAWVRSEMVVHRRADPGDLPPECLTRENVSIGKSDAYDLYCAWCESHDIEPTRPAWFGRDLKTLIPKLQEGRDTRADGSRPMVYRGIGVRAASSPDDEPGIKSDCTSRQKGLAPSQNGAAVLSLSGQSGHLDCFVQLLNEIDKDKGKEKVVENNENALTALTQPPSHDSEGEKRAETWTATNVPVWTPGLIRSGKPAVFPTTCAWNTATAMLYNQTRRTSQSGGSARTWTVRYGGLTGLAHENGRLARFNADSAPSPHRRQSPKTRRTKPIAYTADVLNTLICDIDDGKFDMANPDDLDISNARSPPPSTSRKRQTWPNPCCSTWTTVV